MKSRKGNAEHIDPRNKKTKARERERTKYNTLLPQNLFNSRHTSYLLNFFSGNLYVYTISVHIFNTCLDLFSALFSFIIHTSAVAI